MVIFYMLETKEITSIEDNVMTPTLPLNLTFSEKLEHYKLNKLGFISLPYELGIDAWNYSLCFNELGEFQGLQPKEVINEY